MTEGVVLDIGALDVNGCLRAHCPPGLRYIGADCGPGRNIDLVLDDPYALPLADASVDVVVSSSVLEHSDFFWLLFLEMVRVLKPGGLLYINAPSNGHVHRYPVDCWRFYPDSGRALAAWAVRSGYPVMLIESFIGAQHGPDPGDWSDFVAIFAKSADASARRWPSLVALLGGTATHVYRHDQVLLAPHAGDTEDIRRQQALLAALALHPRPSRWRRLLRRIRSVVT